MRTFHSSYFLSAFYLSSIFYFFSSLLSIMSLLLLSFSSFPPLLPCSLLLPLNPFPSSVCSLPHLFPPVSWFLLVLSQQLLSHTTYRSYCSLWWSGRSSVPMTQSSAATRNQNLSPGCVRLVSGLSGLVLAGGARAVRGVWVVDAPYLGRSARVEGAL